MNNKTNPYHWDDINHLYIDEIEIPPNNAVECDGNYFRVCKTIPPQKSCFQPYVMDHPTSLEKQITKEKKQQVFGLSMHKRVEDSIGVFERLKNAFRHGCVAKGVIPNGYGVSLKTPSRASTEHYTVWLKYHNNVHVNFNVTPTDLILNQGGYDE